MWSRVEKAGDQTRRIEGRVLQVRRKRTQMQGVPFLEKGREEGRREESGACDKPTKDTTKREASTPYKGKSTERRKKVKKDKGKRGSMHDQATKDTIRVEEEFASRVEKESREALWQRGTGGNTPIRIRIVHKENYSNIHRVQIVWREEMPHGKKQRTGGDFR